MKIKKIVLIIIFLFVLTGCTAKVNLEISDSIVYEEINIDDQTTPKEAFRNYIPVFNKYEIVDTEPDVSNPNIQYYKKEIKDNKYVYSYAFKTNNYNESKSMKKFFTSSGLVSSETSGIMELYTSSDGIYAFDLYPKLTHLEINVITDLVVEESNADSVTGNKYTWVFTPNNKNKNIYIRMRNYMYKQVHHDDNNKKNKNNNNNNNNSNNNNNNDPNSNTNGENSGIKADIKYKEKKSVEKQKEENTNYLIIAVLLIVGFLFIIIIIGVINIKKNR